MALKRVVPDLIVDSDLDSELDDYVDNESDTTEHGQETARLRTTGVPNRRMRVVSFDAELGNENDNGRTQSLNRHDRFIQHDSHLLGDAMSAERDS